MQSSSTIPNLFYIKGPTPSPPTCSYSTAMAMASRISRTPTPNSGASHAFAAASPPQTPTPARISYARAFPPEESSGEEEGGGGGSSSVCSLSPGDRSLARDSSDSSSKESSSNSGESSSGGAATIVVGAIPCGLVEGIRDEEDREGVHEFGELPYGLQYAQDCLESLPILIDSKNPETHTVVRGINCHQYAKLQRQHASLDVPDSVLFPFLHGVGNSPSVDSFFARSPQFREQKPSPYYRGLVTILAPGPGDAPATPPLVQCSSLESSVSLASSTRTGGHDGRASHPSTPSLEYAEEGDNDSGVESWGDCSVQSLPVHSEPKIVDSTTSPNFSAPEFLFHPEAPKQSIYHQAPANHIDDDDAYTPPTPPAAFHTVLVDTFPPEAIISCYTAYDHRFTNVLSPGLVYGRFRPIFLGDAVSFRNLDIQPVKYATISDIVVYHPQGLCQSALTVAERFAESVDAEYRKRLKEAEQWQVNKEVLRYNVFVVTDPFSEFEKKYPELVEFDSNGIPRNHIDLFEKERKASAEFTTASEISSGVFVGSLYDVPIADDKLDINSDCGPHQIPYDAVVYCSEFELYNMAGPNDLKDANNTLFPPGPASPGSNISNSLSTLNISSQRQWGEWKTNADRVSVLSSPSGRAVAYLQCTCKTVGSEWKAWDCLAEAFIQLCFWIQHVTDQGKRVILISNDGYTETSILSLVYVMIAFHLSLPDAFLHIQNNAQRSFFVYPSDLNLLRRIEHKITHIRQGPNSGPAPVRPTLENLSEHKSSKGWKYPFWKAKEELDKDLSLRSTSKNKHEWFTNPCFEGSFPSRILPFLYLGNLNHASNPELLHALGITHIVSVGEKALIHPNTRIQTDYQGGGISGGSPNYDLWHECEAGRLHCMDVEKINDDGDSQLRSSIAETIAWIEGARISGGKILIHCRVGVSRSATVVIAYLMKHLDQSFLDSYIFVRARRMSILIQPNLKFLFELQGWEVELNRERIEKRFQGASQSLDIRDQRMMGKKQMSFPIMCKALADLNRRYIG